MAKKSDLLFAVAWAGLGIFTALTGPPWLAVAYFVLAVAWAVGAYSERAAGYLHSRPFSRTRTGTGRPPAA